MNQNRRSRVVLDSVIDSFNVLFDTRENELKLGFYWELLTLLLNDLRYFLLAENDLNIGLYWELLTLLLIDSGTCQEPLNDPNSAL